MGGCNDCYLNREIAHALFKSLHKVRSIGILIAEKRLTEAQCNVPAISVGIREPGRDDSHPRMSISLCHLYQLRKAWPEWQKSLLVLLRSGCRVNVGICLWKNRSEEHTSELQSRPHLVC